MKIQINDLPRAEELNELYADGYRFTVWGDSHTTEYIDPWSGMPSENHNLYAFTNKAEAEAYAQTQTYCYNSQVHPRVEIIPEHTETYTERQEREAREKAERKAKREANDRKKAKEAGLTLEEYRKERSRKAQITRIQNEIRRLKAEIAERESWLKELEG